MSGNVFYRFLGQLLVLTEFRVAFPMNFEDLPARDHFGQQLRN
jgi:hypothetical protein